MDVFTMTQEGRYDAEHIAAAIQRAPWLSADILAKSNSSFYSVGGERVANLVQAVVRIGQKRIGELALISNAPFVGARRSLAWMDPNLAWRRSLAAGVAIEYLVDQGNHYGSDGGLVLAATMHLSGRAALGSMYPHMYREMIEKCRCDNISLVELERHVFPEEHTRVLARLLESWGIPEQVYSPLAQSMESYAAVAQLPEPQRTRVELLKIAASVGSLANARWHSWDEVDIPPIDVLHRLGISDLAKIVEATEEDASAIAVLRKQKPVKRTNESGGHASCKEDDRTVQYVNLSDDSYDILLRVLESIPGIRFDVVKQSEALSTSAFYNGIGATPEAVVSLERKGANRRYVAVHESVNAKHFSGSDQTIVVPCSYGALSSACADISLPTEHESLTTG